MATKIEMMSNQEFVQAYVEPHFNKAEEEGAHTRAMVLAECVRRLTGSSAPLHNRLERTQAISAAGRKLNVVQTSIHEFAGEQIGRPALQEARRLHNDYVDLLWKLPVRPLTVQEIDAEEERLRSIRIKANQDGTITNCLNNHIEDCLRELSDERVNARDANEPSA